MRGTTREPTPPRPKPNSPVWWLVGQVFTFAVFVFLGAFTNVLTEWGGMIFNLWDVPGAEHARLQVAEELGYLQGFGGASAQLAHEATWLTDWVYTILWKWSGAGFLLSVIADLIQSQDPRLVVFADSAALSIQLVALRLVVSTMTLPAFVAVGFVAFIDGLVQRELRKYGGGHESALLYHFAHRNIRPWLITPWVLYLGNPFSVHPNWIFGPCLLLFGIALSIATSKFKKVL